MEHVPLTTVALELGADIGALTVRLGNEITVDERSGLRVVSVSTCRRLIDERDARDAAARAQARAAQAHKAEQVDPVHARVRALQERAARIRADGGTDMSAYEMMCASGKQDSLDSTDEKMNALFAGESYGYKFRQEH